MSIVRKRRIVGFLAVVLAASSAPLPGAQRAAPPARHPAKAIFQRLAAESETAIAQRMMLRPNTPADRLPRLELDIDLGILHRWACTMAAAAAAPDSDAQVAAWLRAQLIGEAIVQADRLLGPRGPATPAQAAAAGQLHDLTFGLPSKPSAQEMDRICQRAGLALAQLAGLDSRKLPLMRPNPVKPDRPPLGPGEQPASAVAAEASRLNVSPQLRVQLVALATAATAPDADAQVRSMLDICLETARALQTNTAVAAGERQTMERQLAEGVALFLDPRTRDAGRGLIESMHTYRVVVSRIRRLNLTSEQMQRLAPLLNWVGDHPGESLKVLSALDRAGAARARFDARDQAPSPIQGLQRPLAELDKQFTLIADRFSSAAVDMPRAGSSNIPRTLDTLADEVVRLGDLVDDLTRMPATLQTLAAFKPRGATTFERRVSQLALIAANAAPSVRRDEASGAIRALSQLAQYARDLSGFDLGDVSGLEHRWTGGRLAAFDAKWRQIVAEQASTIVLGPKSEPEQIARLPQALSLLESLREAVAFDTALAGSADAMERWIDWHSSLAELKPMLLPYPQAMSAAFVGYVNDQPAPVDAWFKVHKRYHPVVALIIRDAVYNKPCAALPQGIEGTAAALITPLDGAPFGAERLTAFTAYLFRVEASSGDRADADALVQALSRRIGGE